MNGLRVIQREQAVVVLTFGTCPLKRGSYLTFFYLQLIFLFFLTSSCVLNHPKNGQSFLSEII